MAELKTKETKASVEKFLTSIKEKKEREDSFVIVKMMEEATGEKGKMWGTSIIGFGNHRYVSERSGREVDWFIIGFSPRKAALTLYLLGGLEMQKGLLEKLGKYKTGKGCLYIKSLKDVDTKVLKSMLDKSVKKLKAKSTK
jgi:hypothetical protein